MNILFSILILLHGIIHVIGFLKSFGLANISQLSQEISKPLGILWLLSCLLFITAFIAKFFNKEWWWLLALIAVVLSQMVIIFSWQDAKFGTIPNLIILISAIIGWGVWNYNMETHKEITILQEEAKPLKEEVIITEDMIKPLPSSVQRWLTNIGLVGREEIHTVHLKQKGLMKLKPDQKNWLNADAEQYITTDKPGFLWRVKLDMIPFVNVVGRDLFVEGKSKMFIKIASLIPVVDVSNNEKTNQSTLQRYLLELPWYPSAALSSYITWESISENSAKATMTYNGVSGTAIYYFNKDGALEKISALRYKDNDENAKLIECIGEVKESSVIDGIKIPTKLNVSWMLDSGKFTWYKLKIFDVEFN